MLDTAVETAAQHWFHLAMCISAIVVMVQLRALRKGQRFIPGDDDDNRGHWKPPAPPPTTNPTPDRVDVNTFGQKKTTPPSLRVEPRAAVAVGAPLYPSVSLPRISRVEMSERREVAALPPATFHYTDAQPWMMENPMFEAIWDEIKTWDVNVPTEYAGYMNCTGNHAAAIMLAIIERVNFEGGIRARAW